MAMSLLCEHRRSMSEQAERKVGEEAQEVAEKRYLRILLPLFLFRFSAPNKSYRC